MYAYVQLESVLHAVPGDEEQNIDWEELADAVSLKWLPDYNIPTLPMLSFNAIHPAIMVAKLTCIQSLIEWVDTVSMTQWWVEKYDKDRVLFLLRRLDLLICSMDLLAGAIDLYQARRREANREAVAQLKREVTQ